MSAVQDARRETAGRVAHAAICYIGVALTSINPDSGYAAAPVYDPPAGSMGWPLDTVLWKPRFDDPAGILVEASELLQLAYELLTNETSIDDKAPRAGASDGTETTGSADQDRIPTTAAPGVHVEALCEPCGVWHSITLRPSRDGDEPITKVRPVCWLCGHRPLVTVGSGRVI